MREILRGVEPPAVDSNGQSARVEPLIVFRRGLARMLNVSEASLDRLRASGKVLRPVSSSLGRPAWSVAEVRAWIASGMPAADVWASMQQAKRR